MSETTTKADIVVGVDGSDESFAALKWALKEASLTGQHVNAVFGWTHSWDMGSEPDSDEAWAKVRHDIANELKSWVEKAAAGIDFDPANLKLTSVKATGRNGDRCHRQRADAGRPDRAFRPAQTGYRRAQPPSGGGRGWITSFTPCFRVCPR